MARHRRWKMFDDGAIEDWETAASVQARNPLFKKNSDRVFANHFRTTKLKLGFSDDATAPRQIDPCNSVPELGIVGPLLTQHRSIASNSNSIEESGHPIAHNKAPCWTWVYTDHEKKMDFVCVAIPAICGKNAKFIISEDGLQLSIKYDWPEVMFKANELFSKSNASNGRKLTLSHPKVHSFISHLHDSGVTENLKLQGDITINFPKKVQRESNSWSIEKVIVSDYKIILLEFSAFQTSLIINDVDTSLDF